MIGIVAALPREVAALVVGFTAHNEQKQAGIQVWRSQKAVVVAAGMGAERAMLAVQTALATGSVTELYSVGLVGACDPAVHAGSVVEAGTIVDTQTGERYATAAAGSPNAVTLATAPEIASVREKSRLYSAYGASAVDMEAATVARLAMNAHLPFRAIKAVSDDAAFELEGMGKFATKHRHFDTAAFGLHTALRPHTWGKAMQLGRHSGAALKALTAELKKRITEN